MPVRRPSVNVTPGKVRSTGLRRLGTPRNRARGTLNSSILSAQGAGSSDSQKIRVAVRVRPPSQYELSHGRHENVVDVVSEHLLVFDPPLNQDNFYFHGAQVSRRDMLKRRRKDLSFCFEPVLGPQLSNYEVFENVNMTALVQHVLRGFNASVMAYGATGSGKTHTMLGSEKDPGLVFHTIHTMYDQMQTRSDEYRTDLSVSYLEVYNETPMDLLDPTARGLTIRDDNGKPHVQGLSSIVPESAEHLLSILQRGNEKRTQHATDVNAQSSRSHAVFMIHVKSTPKAAGMATNVNFGKLVLVDLAGSERLAATQSRTKVRALEGKNINKSLLALGGVINALATKQRHIPFRNSNLTRLLMDCIGGNCKSVFLAAVSPSSLTYDDTFNTLQYAKRAKNITFRALKKEMSDCKEENEALKKSGVELEAKYKSALEQLSEMEERLKTAILAEGDTKAELEEVRGKLRASQERVSTEVVQDEIVGDQVRVRDQTIQKLKEMNHALMRECQDLRRQARNSANSSTSSTQPVSASVAETEAEAEGANVVEEEDDNSVLLQRKATIQDVTNELKEATGRLMEAEMEARIRRVRIIREKTKLRELTEACVGKIKYETWRRRYEALITKLVNEAEGYEEKIPELLKELEAVREKVTALRDENLSRGNEDFLDMRYMEVACFLKDRQVEYLSTLLGVGEQVIGSYRKLFGDSMPTLKKWYLTLQGCGHARASDADTYQAILSSIEQPSIRWQSYLDVTVEGSEQMSRSSSDGTKGIVSIRTLVDPPASLHPFFWPNGQKGALSFKPDGCGTVRWISPRLPFPSSDPDQATPPKQRRQFPSPTPRGRVSGSFSPPTFSPSSGAEIASSTPFLRNNGRRQRHGPPPPTVSWQQVSPVIDDIHQGEVYPYHDTQQQHPALLTIVSPTYIPGTPATRLTPIAIDDPMYHHHQQYPATSGPQLMGSPQFAGPAPLPPPVTTTTYIGPPATLPHQMYHYVPHSHPMDQPPPLHLQGPPPSLNSSYTIQPQVQMMPPPHPQMNGSFTTAPSVHWVEAPAMEYGPEQDLPPTSLGESFVVDRVGDKQGSPDVVVQIEDEEQEDEPMAGVAEEPIPQQPEVSLSLVFSKKERGRHTPSPVPTAAVENLHTTVTLENKENTPPAPVGAGKEEEAGGPPKQEEEHFDEDPFFPPLPPPGSDTNKSKGQRTRATFSPKKHQMLFSRPTPKQQTTTMLDRRATIGADGHRGQPGPAPTAGLKRPRMVPGAEGKPFSTLQPQPSVRKPQVGPMGSATKSKPGNSVAFGRRAPTGSQPRRPAFSTGARSRSNSRK
ncbi:unnamed protein product [Cyprideis torosa]|uniref:Uncharacterized protein n=1 Tax=Cyprideis torosa TaxID=163714 RepID=A0A7R8ZL95_9CRUS|nr:unnamed protein product [Cyprideis torosa]CAG0886132.1 unnamed protein product [Cyprideis torosa]